MMMSFNEEFARSEHRLRVHQLRRRHHVEDVDDLAGGTWGRTPQARWVRRRREG